MKIVIKLVEYFVNSCGFLLAKIPHKWFLAIVKSVAFLMRLMDRRRFFNAMENLDFIYGETLTQEKKKIIITRCYENFAFILLEGFAVKFIPFERYSRKFEVVDEHYLIDSLKNDGSAVLIGGHFGYWEAMATLLPRKYQEYKMASVGRLTKFEAINRLIVDRREAQGVKLIEKKGAFRHLLKLYSEGSTLAGILVDQNISASDGVWVNFFGKETTHTTIASILSRRFGVNIVPVFIDFNQDYSRFQIRFYPPIRTQNTKNSQQDVLEATQAQARITQEVIQANPSSWFWFHKRWKAKYNHIYKR